MEGSYEGGDGKGLRNKMAKEEGWFKKKAEPAEKKDLKLETVDDLHEAAQELKGKYQVLIDETGTHISPLVERVFGDEEEDEGLIGDIHQQFRLHPLIKRSSFGAIVKEMMKDIDDLRGWMMGFSERLMLFIRDEKGEHIGFIDLVDNSLDLLEDMEDQLEEKDRLIKKLQTQMQEMKEGKGEEKKEEPQSTSQKPTKTSLSDTIPMNENEKIYFMEQVNRWLNEWIRFYREDNDKQAGLTKGRLFNLGRSDEKREIIKTIFDETYRKEYGRRYRKYGTPEKNSDFFQSVDPKSSNGQNSQALSPEESEPPKEASE